MNFLGNGAVLPSGLLTLETGESDSAFNRTYKNHALKIGVVIASYPVNDSNNQSKLTIEYDVVAVEQNEDRGGTTITYKNCMSAQGLGSIADYFEKTLRPSKRKSTKGSAVKLKGQDGSIVLLLCLDGASEKAIIVGSMPHPDKQSGIKTSGPYLEGEYNGVNIKVNEDGSTSLTWKGATDGDGTVIDGTLVGNTVMSMEKDGSYQVNHSTITHRLDKKGTASLTAKDSISNTTDKSFNVTAKENVIITAIKDLNAKMNQLIMEAQGSASLICQSLKIDSQSDITIGSSQFQVQAESMAGIKAAVITLDGQVALGGAGGQPLLMLGAQMLGIGNLGIPVLSSVIFGFTNKVTGQ